MAPNGADALSTAMAFRESLARVVAALAPQRADREEIVQETLLRLLESDLGDVRSVEAWMTAVARRIAIDRRRRRHPSSGAIETLAVADPGIDEDRALRERLGRCLAAHLAHLEGEDARLLEAVDVLRRPRAELAQELGLSASGLGSRVQRARRRLRGLFDACCRVELDDRGRPAALEPRRGDSCSC